MGGALLLIWQRGVASGGSIAARWAIWQASLRLLWPRLWLGYGADTLELHFPAVYPPQLVYYQGRGVVVDRAHNWLLDWSLSYGVVATLLLAGLVYLILRAGWRQLAHAQAVGPTAVDTTAVDPTAAVGQSVVGQPLAAQQAQRRWLAACMAAIGTQLVGNLFLFEVAATAVVFWLLLAIVVAATAHLQREATARPWSPRTKRAVAALAFVLLSWLIGQSNVRPLLADIHSWRGTQALNRGDAGLALVDYARAVRYQPQRASYHGALAFTAAEVGNFAQAERSMQRAIALRPADPVLHTQLATLYERAAVQSPPKLVLAHHAYERAIALAPTVALSYQQYADFALRAGDVALARRLAQQAVELDATDGIAFGILGWAHLHENEVAAAQRAFTQAVKWQPNSADFHLGLATAYFQQGAFDAARAEVQQSLLLDPTYAPALTLQVQLE